jgi:phosphoenolpyruvate carboxykinase (ATP)
MITRDKITWQRDDFWGYDIPSDIPGVDLDRFNPQNYYDNEQIEQLSHDFKKERLAWLAQFPSLNRDIITAINK